MKFLKLSGYLIIICFASCQTPKSFFTVGTRKMLESNSISVDKIQFYIDRDVELSREITSGETKVSSGKVKFENGKYIHTILLKKNTPGVCTKIYDNRLDISFEMGEGKFLVFVVPNDASPETNYQISARIWINQHSSVPGEIGKITYDNKGYFIQPGGSSACLMIKKSIVNKLKVEKRVMRGRKI